MIDLKKIEKDFASDLDRIKNLNDYNNIQSKYLGKNSLLNNSIKNIKNLSNEDKKTWGKSLHQLRLYFLNQLKIKYQNLNNTLIQENLSKNKIDITLPGVNINVGNFHPISIVLKEIQHVFTELGYNIFNGREVDTDLYNFELLDISKNHPARNMHDTFYLKNNKLLRTHSTNTSSRILSELNFDKEIKSYGILSMGNVYRRDTDDATHSHQFTQVDAVFISPNISFANLKWTLEYFCKRMFGDNTKTRLRPSCFPFTKLSAEVDISCPYCDQKGCNVCKETGWIEILGSGLFSQKVHQLCNIPKNFTSLAFGIGIERIAMIKYRIKDIREFYINNLNFLKEFKLF